MYLASGPVDDEESLDEIDTQNTLLRKSFEDMEIVLHLLTMQLDFALYIVVNCYHSALGIGESRGDGGGGGRLPV